MGYIHTLNDAQAPARSDNVLWTQVEIQESTDNVTFAVAQTLALDPPETDPQNPVIRDITFESPLQEGWYRLVFIDQNADQSPPTASVFDGATASEDTVPNPTVDDVADLLQTRTRLPGGTLAGTFTDATLPTGQVVQRLIAQAHNRIIGKTGAITKEVLKKDATELIRLYTAMQIELSYYSEQVNTNRSPYPKLKELYDAGLAALIEGLGGEGNSAVDEVGTTGTATFNTPNYSFPPTSIGDGIMP